MRVYSWIREELARLFPQDDLTKGIDLNKNGQLEEHERITDANNNGTIGDAEDWQAFAKRNLTTLKSIDGLFKWGAAFKLDNPLHDALSVEAPHATPAAIKKVYAVAATMLKYVRQKEQRDKANDSAPSSTPSRWSAIVNDTTLTPKGKVAAIYEGMAKTGLVYSKDGGRFITTAIAANKYKCDTSAILAMGVAHALGFKTSYVQVPEHAFMRFDDGRGVITNADQGNFKSDEYYIKAHRIDPASIRNKSYLVSLTPDQFVGERLVERSNIRQRVSKHKEAVADAERAVALNPTSIRTQFWLGTVYYDLKDYRKAIHHLTIAIRLDPKNIAAYTNRAIARTDLGDLKGSQEDANIIQILRKNARPIGDN